MRVHQGLTSIQMIQTQQAFQASRVKPAETPAVNPLEHMAVPKPEASTSQNVGLSGDAYREIKSIGQRAGYLDVPDEAIRRAYLHGDSLLSDYRV
jgi:hypothetical protein